MFPRLVLALFLALLIALATYPVFAAERRVALVIGNNAYRNVVALDKAVADARAMAATLQSVGFEVMLRENLDRRSTNLALGEFVDKIAAGGVGLFYFAGHGVQIGGSNYLLPVDVPALRNQEDLRDEAIDLGRVLERVAEAKAKLDILIIDACRDNPFPKIAGRSIGGTRGLAIPAAPNGILIVYSAGVNETAIDTLGPDDKSPNGLFTRELLPYIKERGLRLYDAVRQARKAVAEKARATGSEQNPAIYDQTDGDFYFVPQPGAVAAASPVPATPAPVAAAAVAPTPSATASPPLQQFAVTTAGSYPPPPRNLAELDALAAAKSWHELGDHLRDIRPTQRDAHWRQLVEEAALGELMPLAENEDGPFEQRLAALARYYPAFPSLAQSPRFLALRTRVGLAAYRQCFASGDWAACREHLEDFVRTVPVQADLAQSSAALAARGVSQAAAAPFYAIAVGVPGGERACSDPGLANAVVAGLGGNPGDPEPKAAAKLLQSCWAQLREPVLADFGTESPESNFLKNSCPVLSAHNALSGLRAAHCEALSRAGN